MDQKSPLVTVLISTYNKSQVLRHTIKSVLWQNFQDWELWVVGDACTDDSEQVVKGFQDPRVNWYNLPVNSGYQSEPHNEGLRRARGEYIAYLNHDDIWFPNHLEVLLKAMEEQGADLAYSIMEWVLYWADSYADIPIYPNAPLPPEASATMHRRNFIDEIGFWNPPEETHAVPRAEYFRRAQFLEKKFVLVPYLTVLKFGGSPGDYGDEGPQPQYMQRIMDDPDFAHTELAKLLAGSYHKLEKPPKLKEWIYLVSQTIRRYLVTRKIDPAKILFWRKPGRHIRAWRKAHRLD